MGEQAANLLAGELVFGVLDEGGEVAVGERTDRIGDGALRRGHPLPEAPRTRPVADRGVVAAGARSAWWRGRRPPGPAGAGAGAGPLPGAAVRAAAAVAVAWLTPTPRREPGWGPRRRRSPGGDRECADPSSPLVAFF